MSPDGTCGNPVCSWSDRSIERVDAIAAFTDPLAAKIKSLKYNGQTGWALIFGRLVHGWLEANASSLAIDLITPNPTFAGGDPALRRRHTELVVQYAAQDDLMGRWPFDAEPWAVTKQVETVQSAGRSWKEKKTAAEAHAAALTIDAGRIRGRRVLIFDDVSTTLLQMEFVARRLRLEGATSVQGLVLARAGH